ncbi:hypothetical protein A2U01_0050832 [Trifolium medium]|uniref:Uncharacterized protein n=1 Tax=Trifolium medium TaxID=97028 RepID=A0A392QZ41_9FABA|nr:hypothetical protein [Trifolium medium]
MLSCSDGSAARKMGSNLIFQVNQPADGATELVVQR